MKRSVSVALTVLDEAVRDDDRDVVVEDGLARVDRSFGECIWVDDDYYVGALVDADQTVVLFTITTRSRWFAPKFQSAPEPAHPRASVKLGRTRFTELDEEPQRIFGSLGARRFFYGEEYDFANPGHYQHFVCALSDAGLHTSKTTPFDPDAGIWDIDRTSVAGEDSASVRLRAFRRDTVVNTWTVVGPTIAGAVDMGATPLYLGVDPDVVRTLP